MNFTEFCKSLTDPLYETKGGKKCPKGFRFNKKLNQCVPIDKQGGYSEPRPEMMDSVNVWGATGINGDGYAVEDESASGGES